MSCLRIPILPSSSSSSQKRVHAYAAIAVPELTRVRISLPKIPTSSSTTRLVHESNNASSRTITPAEKHVANAQMPQYFGNLNESRAKIQLYAILESVAERVEMHKNFCEQRNLWKSLLLNSVDMMMVGLKSSVRNTAFKLTSTLLLTAAKSILLVINKIRTPRRKEATTLFEQLQVDIKTKLTHGNPTEEDVNSAMERVLALDKAYPLPLLLGTMLDKFPSKFEHQMRVCKLQKKTNNNGWTPELEMEMRQIIEVVKRKDLQECEKKGNLALNINKTLALLGPLLTGIAALSSALAKQGSCWAGTVAVMAGSMADCINALEHGGQMGMVFEMSRNCAGFCKLLQETVEATLEEKDCEKRENGELFEMKVAKQLGRSVSRLRRLASKSAACDLEGIALDEFARRLF